MPVEEIIKTLCIQTPIIIQDNMTFIYIYSICKLILGKIANFPKIADTLTKFFHTEHTNFSRERENRAQKVLYGASLAGSLILLAGTENSANGISWLILVIGSK